MISNSKSINVCFDSSNQRHMVKATKSQTSPGPFPCSFSLLWVRDDNTFPMSQSMLFYIPDGKRRSERAIDNYIKDDGPGAARHFCSFCHDPLCT